MPCSTRSRTFDYTYAGSPLCIYRPRSANARYMRHAIPHAMGPDTQACLTGEGTVKEVAVSCELKRVQAHLHEKRHDYALLEKDDFLSCPHFTRSEAAELISGKGYHMARYTSEALAARPDGSHSTVSHADAIQASSAQPCGRQPLSQPNTRRHSQPSPRHKATRELGPQPIKHRPGRGGNSQASTAAERFDSRGSMPHGR